MYSKLDCLLCIYEYIHAHQFCNHDAHVWPEHYSISSSINLLKGNYSCMINNQTVHRQLVHNFTSTGHSVRTQGV